MELVLSSQQADKNQKRAVLLLKHNPETDLFNEKFSETGLFIVLVCDFNNFF